MQFTKRRKIYILVGMFVLLAVTGYLNFALNGDATRVGGDLNKGKQDIFLMFRETRTAERNANKAILQAISESENYTVTARDQAAAQLFELMQTISFEDNCETLILAQGFANVVVTRSGNDNVTILLKNPIQLEEFEVANILSVVQNKFIGEFDVEKVFLSIIE